MDRRNEMRGLFSTRGWFSDDMFSDPLSTVKTVNRKGIIFEQNNLRALERAKLAGFTGEWIWLL
jgi:hypothetical protein